MSYFPPGDLPLLGWAQQDRTLADVLSDSEPDVVREVWRSIAVCLVGYGAADKPKGRRKAYQAIVGPGESAGMLRDMLTMSGCGLVGGCCFRCAGVRDPMLEPPYRIGWAIDRLRLIGVRSGAYTTPEPGRAPGIGDLAYVGHPKPPKPRAPTPEQLELWQRAVNQWLVLYGGEAHVFMVVSNDGNQVASVGGGQVDAAGAQCIKQTSRRVEWRGPSGTRLWIGGRRCSWFLDCTKLPYTAPWVLPVPGPGWPFGVDPD